MLLRYNYGPDSLFGSAEVDTLITVLNRVRATAAPTTPAVAVRVAGPATGASVSGSDRAVQLTRWEGG